MQNNYAFIDGQNLYLNIVSQGWKLDYMKFRLYLKEKYGIAKAFIFLGYLSENESMYSFLIKCGFVIIFKEITLDSLDKIKGNCDVELALQTMIEFLTYDKAVIVSGDGDFYCLAKHLFSNKKLKKIIVPNESCYSRLFKRLDNNKYSQVTFMNLLKDKLEYFSKIKRTP